MQYYLLLEANKQKKAIYNINIKYRAYLHHIKINLFFVLFLRRLRCYVLFKKEANKLNGFVT